MKECKHEALWLTNHNSYQCFVDTKRFSLKRVCSAQELLKYYIQIDYYQSKANEAADALTQYSHRSAEEENTPRAKKGKILHQLLSLLAWVLGLRILGSELLFYLQQVLISGTVVQSQLHQFQEFITGKRAHEYLYTTTIKAMTMRLAKLRDDDKDAKKLKLERQQMPEV